jgi:hypothetical protein
MRTVLLAAATLAVFPAAAGAADPTPEGPLTLLNDWSGPSTAEGRWPEVLVGARITVGEGSRAGTIRIRARHGDVNAVSDPVELPAEPGTYTFPAPHIRWDYRTGDLGLDQTTGGHALIDQASCDPAQGRDDPCELQRIDVFAAGDPANRIGTQPGAKLAITGIFEADIDRDLVGDKTEDRTDLRLSTDAKRDADGRLRLSATITNAGPLVANFPTIQIGPLGIPLIHGRWQDGCHHPSPWGPTADAGGTCRLTPLAVGESRTVTLVGDLPDAVTATLVANAEGADLTPADGTSPVSVAAAPTFDLVAAGKQRLRRGAKVQVRGVRAGKARVTVAFKVRGRTVKLARTVTLTPYTARTVTLRPRGPKLRSLRRAVARGPVKATITVRPSGGGSPVTAKTVVR